MFVYGDLKTVYVCLWWPEDCLCLFMVARRLFMLILCCDGPFWTAYIGCVLFFFFPLMVLRSLWHMVCSFLFDFIGHRHTISKSVQSTCTCPAFGAFVWKKKKKKAALAASLEWMHLIIWAPIGGSVGIVTTSILSSGAGTMGLRDSVCCVQSSVPGLLSASAILSKLGA